MKKKLLRILIIEDNIDHIELLSEVIERNFIPVDIHTVETVDDAIDFLGQTEYDLVFTDLYIESDSIVKQIPHLRSKLGETPIIVITGSGDESLAAEVIKRGATDYLVKNRDSLEKIPGIINKYTKYKDKYGEEKLSGRAALPVKEQLLDEVSVLTKRAKKMTSQRAGRTPDSRQLDSLLDQIQRLKELASKMKDK